MAHFSPSALQPAQLQLVTLQISIGDATSVSLSPYHNVPAPIAPLYQGNNSSPNQSKFYSPSSRLQKITDSQSISLAKAVAPKKSRSKKRKVHVVKTDDTDANGSPAPIEIDMVQDSDQENSKFKCQKNKKKKKEQIFDNIEDYFEKPTRAENDESGPPLLYKCKWCANTYK
ncbi:hypothetical protein PCANC_17765 [Puccinia coronata f. sp. avenae]|uniref:Uncharacterized protein n=1 Tax=Puccinia coronata f. sp. avenae TaxID=200324 RepID=A0A2N5SJ73_9BASI|nr:hypothetical protein PCANC_17765 [Puccinia coronata f. sp. avenae]